MAVPLEGKNGCQVSVEDDAGHKSIIPIWNQTQHSIYTSESHFPKTVWMLTDVADPLPDVSMDRALRDTEIFSSEVLTQSSMPLQPFIGKVKLELVVVGLLWMLNTRVRKIGRVGGEADTLLVSATSRPTQRRVEEVTNAGYILLPCHVICGRPRHYRRDPV